MSARAVQLSIDRRGTTPRASGAELFNWTGQNLAIRREASDCSTPISRWRDCNGETASEPMSPGSLGHRPTPCPVGWMPGGRRRCQTVEQAGACDEEHNEVLTEVLDLQAAGSPDSKVRCGQTPYTGDDRLRRELPRRSGGPKATRQVWRSRTGLTMPPEGPMPVGMWWSFCDEVSGMFDKDVEDLS